MVTEPVMFNPSITAPGVLITMLPDGFRVTPAGTPAVVASGNAVVDAKTKSPSSFQVTSCSRREVVFGGSGSMIGRELRRGCSLNFSEIERSPQTRAGLLCLFRCFFCGVYDELIPSIYAGANNCCARKR
jgi:hypothetical protein